MKMTVLICFVPRPSDISKLWVKMDQVTLPVLLRARPSDPGAYKK